MTSDAASTADAYVSHVISCIEKARRGESKCTREILDLDGMSGNMTRHLYNTLCELRRPDGGAARYLEVGAWKGSSTLSALYQNPVHATIIDNWSEFGSPRAYFRANLGRVLGMPGAESDAMFSDQLTQPGQQLQLVNEDCFQLTTELKFAPYDIYLYDGFHSQEAQRQALTDLWQHLADPCIVLIDDWEWAQVQAGTREGLEAVGAQVVASWDVLEPGGRGGFWNGSGIFVLRK